MNKQDLRIVFFGTPEFAVASLKHIIDAGYNVTAVVTAPDKPAGRGMQLQQSAVKQYAVAAGIPVLQPVKLRDPDFLSALRACNATLQIVIAFRMLPEIVWNMPPLGTFNLHASLLPQYRGAAPINWAIINGETETGVTTFFLKHEIDTGNILRQRKIVIGPEDTAGELHDTLMYAGAELVGETLDAIITENYTETEQVMSPELKHAPKIFKPDCVIDWNKNAGEVFNLIRGLSPYPAAHTTISGKSVKVFKASVVSESSGQPGQITTDGKSYLEIACKTGTLRVLELQAEGKKRMGIAEYLRGNSIQG